MKRAAEAVPAAVRNEWLRRVEAEYRSAAITGQLTHWLIQLGAPSASVRVGLRIVADELRHAELSQRVYRAAGGDRTPALAREHLEMTRSPGPLEHDVTRVIVQTFCFGETAAVRLFHRMRVRCRVPAARKALDRILLDEVRHRDFGWRVLTWLLDLPDAGARRADIQSVLPQLVAGLRASYGADGPSNPPPLAADIPTLMRDWGLMPRDDYRRAIDLCVARDLRPRFARLGLRI